MVFIQRCKRAVSFRRAAMGLCVLLVSGAMLFSGCAGTTGALKTLEEPGATGILLIGNVLVENINQGLQFANWDFPAELLIVGKGDDGVLKNYTVNTDPKGYFFLSNVPPAQYAIKAVTVPLFGTQAIRLISKLDYSDVDFYNTRHPERPIELTEKWLPAKSEGPIADFHFLWLGLRRATVEDLASEYVGQVLVQKASEGLKNKRFWTQGYVYTREEPLAYFKSKFPNSGWWKK